MDFRRLIGKKVQVYFGDLKKVFNKKEKVWEEEYNFQTGILVSGSNEIIVLDFKGKLNIIKGWKKIREVNNG